jgi:hypothetical protein
MSIRIEDVLHKRGKVNDDLMLYLDGNGVKRLLKDLSIDGEGLNSYLDESIVINYKDRMNSSKEGSVICSLVRIVISEERTGFTFRILKGKNGMEDGVKYNVTLSKVPKSGDNSKKLIRIRSIDIKRDDKKPGEYSVSKDALVYVATKSNGNNVELRREKVRIVIADLTLERQADVRLLSNGKEYKGNLDDSSGDNYILRLDSIEYMRAMQAHNAGSSYWVFLNPY